MKYQLKQFAILFFSLLILSPAFAQKNDGLTTATPESQGVSSEGILQFLDAAQKSKTEFHSLMILRHGKAIAEGWWNPYGPDLKHTLYSCSKSFTATAIGFAVSEKLLTVEDKVISFFPNELPDTVSDFLSALRVKDVLSMSDGQEPEPGGISRDSNWVKSFLAVPIKYQPGTKFLYNSLGTYMLSAIVQKVTGQKVIDYLKPRLFEPLGITGIDWEVDPKGINTGGWGLRLKTSDMAKFGQLFLQKGKWNGKQVLPEFWVNEASTMKIIQHPDLPQAKKDSSDWEQGYCYQMWRCRHNGFRADGAFGQYIIVLPDEDAVVAITAETTDMQEEINLVWKYLLPAMQKNSLAPDKPNEAKLTQRLSSLALALPAKASSALAGKISGKTFIFGPNEKHLKSLSLKFAGDKCTASMVTDTATYQLDFENGSWKQGQTTRHGPYLVAAARANLTGLPPFKIAGAYTWKDTQALELDLRYIESPHTEKILCNFEGNDLSLDIENSFDHSGKKTVLKGRIEE